MALQVFTSNKLESLADILIQNRKVFNDVFNKEYIITQTTGMQQWLSVLIAEKTGVFSNFEFLNSNDLISTIYDILGGTKKPITQWISTWVIYSVLNEKEFQKLFPYIFSYYENNELKQIQLSQKLADLFDQYQIYRPDYINAWNKDKEINIPHEPWQFYIWKKLKHLISNSYCDKTEISDFITEKLQSKDQFLIKEFQNKFNKISFFGLSTLTNYHIHIITLLSELIDIDFYLVNPSPEDYWFEDKSEKEIAKWEKISGNKYNPNLFNQGNPLLINYGKVVSDLFLNLFNYDDFINNLNNKSSFNDNDVSLLKYIQYKIYSNSNISDTKLPEKLLYDKSISVSSCYTQQREVEVLYNYIVGLLDTDKINLRPSDILIIVPDIDEYASYITATFDNASYKLPYYIADRTYSSDDTISAFILNIFNLADDHHTSEQILELINNTWVKRKFGYSNLSLIRHIIDAANIRYGLEGNKNDDTKYISWKAGIEKIILGIALYGDNKFLLNDEVIYPLDILEGESSREMLKVIAFLNEYIKIIKEILKPKTLKKWKDFIIINIIDNFIDINDDNENEYKYLLNILQRFEDSFEVNSSEISFEAFRYILTSSLKSGTQNTNFINGKITFCSAIPLRSIPYKFIGFLGLNKDKFPRKITELGFDLMNFKKRKGDRNIKENDKHLFLETIIAAKDYLYFSYIGKNQTDNSDLSPSILLDDFVDYIESLFPGKNDIRNEIVNQHPLHGYSKVYFNNQTKYYTYLGHENNNLNHFGVTVELPEPPVPSLNNLIDFYNNTVKYYFNNILNIYLEEENVGIAETELFGTDNLQNWILRNDLTQINEDEINEYIDKAKKCGLLPLKNLAKVTVETQLDEISSMKSRYIEIKNNSDPITLEAEYQYKDNKIPVVFNNVYNSTLIELCLSKSDYKYILQAWIKHLFSIATGQNLTTFILFYNRDEIKLNPDIVSNNESAKILNKLFDYYYQGCKDILLFHPKAAYAFLKNSKYMKIFNELAGYNEKVIPDPYFEKIAGYGLLDENNFAQEIFEDISNLIFHENLMKTIKL